jgi:signal transduction histidine kinase
MYSKLSHVVDALPDGILLIDSDWRLSYANPAARRISRLRDEHMFGPTYWQIYPEVLNTPLEALARAAMQERRPGLLDAFYYPPFNIWCDVHVLPIETGIAMYYRDVSAVHQSRLERQAAREQLEQVLNTTTDNIISMDRDYRITYINARARETLAPSGDLEGKLAFESFPNMSYPGSPYEKAYRTAMEDRVAASFTAFYPAPLNAWFEIHAEPAPEGIIVFFHDITRDKQREAALIQTEKLAAVGRMASSIAHEINNPLESVTNLIYLAQSHAILPEVQHYLSLAEQELRRVSAIANQTLRFHKQGSAPREITCSELFATVLTLYEGRLKNSAINVRVSKRAEQAIACFEGDIRQVLNNFVANAIDAMPSGGQLLLRSRESTDWRPGPGYGRRGLTLTVADTGHGISSAVRARVTEPFFTTKGNQGTGLGLWISAEIVRRHHGHLLMRTSESPEHHGTVFSIFLPFDAVHSMAEPVITVGHA